MQFSAVQSRLQTASVMSYATIWFALVLPTTYCNAQLTITANKYKDNNIYINISTISIYHWYISDIVKEFSPKILQLYII